MIPAMQSYGGVHRCIVLSLHVEVGCMLKEWSKSVTRELKKLHVIAGTKVEVKWDQAPDNEGCKESTIGEQSLLPSKWNKDNKEDAWTMDVDIEVTDELDDENDDQDEVGNSEIVSACDSDGDT